jgi:hypothetical protein
LLGLILRSIAISAFTRVFDALWRCVSKDGRESDHVAHPSRRAFRALLRMRYIYDGIKKKPHPDELAKPASHLKRPSLNGSDDRAG